MLNLSSVPVALIGENLIDENVRAAIGEVIDYIDDKCGGCEVVEYHQITAGSTGFSILMYFKKFFGFSVVGGRRYYDYAWVLAVFRYVNGEPGGVGQENLRVILGEAYIDYRASGRAALKRGLWLVLVLLFKKRAILLPANFRALRAKVSDGKYSDFGFEIYPELVKFFISARHKTLGDERFWGGVDIKVRERIAQYGSKLCWISGFVEPESVKLELIIEAYEEFYYKKNGRAAEMPVKTIVPFILRRFWERLSFGHDIFSDALEALKSHWQQRRINEKSKSFQFLGYKELGEGSEFEQEIVEFCRGCTRSHLFPSYVNKNGMPAWSVQSIDDWINCESLYLSARQPEVMKSAQYGFGMLNLYLAVYLPLWFNAQSCCSGYVYPSSPKLFLVDFCCPPYRAPNAPMPFETFIFEIVEVKAKCRVMQQIKAFFEWLRAKFKPGNKYAIASLILKYDLPFIERLSKTDKCELSYQEHAFSLNYLYCVLGAVITLNESVLTNGAEIKNWPNLYDAARFLGWVPMFCCGGKNYQVDELPRGLFTRWRVPVAGGAFKTILAPHRIVHLLFELDSGKRNQSAQWLGVDCLDGIKVEELDSNRTYEVKTKVDKVQKFPSPTFVSDKTIRALRYQLELRDQIFSPAFSKEIYYEGNKKSQFGKFMPLFSFNVATGFPYSDRYYCDGFCFFLQAIQRFLRRNFMSCSLHKMMPVGMSFFDSIDPVNVIVREGGDGEYCPVTTVYKLTPHSTRVSVDTNLSRHVAHEVIGKYKTGQKRSVVAYYDKSSFHRSESELASITEATKLLWSGDAVQAGSPKSAFRRAVEYMPDVAMDEFGCISYSMEDAGEPTGVERIKLKAHSGLAHHPTHICTRNNNCPFGFNCGTCIWSVSGVDHIEAIEYKIFCYEREICELHSFADTLDVGEDDGCLAEIDSRLRNAAHQIVAWRWKLEQLQQNWHKISQTGIKFVTMRPDILKRHLVCLEMDGCEAEYVLVRMYQAVQFPSLQNDCVRAEVAAFAHSVLANTHGSVVGDQYVGHSAVPVLGLVKSIISERWSGSARLLDLLSEVGGLGSNG